MSQIFSSRYPLVCSERIFLSILFFFLVSFFPRLRISNDFPVAVRNPIPSVLICSCSVLGSVVRSFYVQVSSVCDLSTPYFSFVISKVLNTISLFLLFHHLFFNYCALFKLYPFTPLPLVAPYRIFK